MSASSLFKTLTLRGGAVTLKNRVVMASLTRGRSGASRVPNATNVEYYGQRSGAGLVIVEATAVSELGNGWKDSAGIYNNEQMQGWRKVNDEVHSKGGKSFCQLWFIARQSHSSFMPGQCQIVSASDVNMNGEVYNAQGAKVPSETPRPLTLEEIPSIVEMYGNAARLAREAGFDGVEIHAANGYLVDQFLQTCSNKRTDAYGGSKENRFRFCREVLERCLLEFPASRIGLKLSPNGVYGSMGSPTNYEDFTYFAAELEKYKVAYLQVMDGLAFGFHNLSKPVTLEGLRAVFKGTLIGNCGYDQKSAEAMISAGHGDAVAFGRAYLANPDLAERMEKGLPLADTAPGSVWYNCVGNMPSIGYTDFPFHRA